ncbi:DsbA family protein [Sphingomonas carotinifaciens]|uniref:Protein-disulfide isomerase n=2 Tax=Sphingomonas carotinifaciens TaxID=1166323 RepID=A0A1G7FQ85_9SPHN|nr:protein-disulfide isomerase [Sphingomonas carotinifaciens]SDE78063.1 Protein-disulfide isomerase [Sphingomonas carotinifaciens]
MNRLVLALVAALGLAVGALGMLLVQTRGETDVRAYLLEHPEVIPEAMARLQERESGKAVAQVADQVTKPFGSAWSGNPKGDVTLVEYYDYNCGYCRASLPLLKQLTDADSKLRIVYRELPILAESSRDAARMSLLAAAQGKFQAFHDALYAGGQVTDASIAAAARTAGVDTGKLAAFTPTADAEIVRNMETAGRLGLNGTPAWIVGSRVLSGALPLEELQKAIADARR